MFVTAKAQDLFTYARSTTGTYIGSDGLLKTAAVNEARIEYAADGSLKGLLIEEQRTNLITHSENFSNAAWGKFGGGVIVADAATSPDGTSNASQFYGSDGAHVIEDVSATAGTTYTFSVFVKTNGTDVLTFAINYRDGGGNSINYYGVDFNTATGVISAPDLGVQATTSNTENFGNGWFRLSISHEAPATTTTARLYMANRTGATASSSDGYLLYGAQLEVRYGSGSFATSYIPTSNGQKTREPDIAYMPVSEFNYNQEAGTVVVDYSMMTGVFSASPYIVQFDDGTETNRILLMELSNSSRFFMNVSGITQETLVNEPISEGVLNRSAAAFTENDTAMSTNGSVAEAGDGTSTVPGGITTVRLSGNTSNNNSLNGHIRSLKYWPQRLSDATLQAVTQG